MTEGQVITMMQGINKFLYCGWNYTSVLYKGQYVPKFIVEADWSCNTDHILDKWNYACTSGTDGRFPAFYSLLDGTNRKAFMRWVVENYNGEPKLFN